MPTRARQTWSATFAARAIRRLADREPLVSAVAEREQLAASVGGASAPRLAAVVIIDEPGGDLYYGSDVAAPVFAEVMTESLRLMAIPPDALPARDAGSIMQAMSR